MGLHLSQEWSPGCRGELRATSRSPLVRAYADTNRGSKHNEHGLHRLLGQADAENTQMQTKYGRVSFWRLQRGSWFCKALQIFPLNLPSFVVPQDSQGPYSRTALCRIQLSPPSFSTRAFCSLSLAILSKLSYPTTDAVQDHRIMECFGLERTFKCHLVQPPSAMDRDIFQQVRQLRTLPNLAFNVSRDGESITSLGNLRVRRMKNARRTGRLH